VTEIRELPPELAAMFAQQQGLVPNPGSEAARKAFQDAVQQFEREAYARVQFLAPVLCSCPRHYDWDEPSPPQHGCAVHGYVMTDRDTGAAYLFGIPRHW
jgi:hypothetical protein